MPTASGSRWTRLLDRIEAALTAVAFAEEAEVEVARRLSAAPPRERAGERRPSRR